MKVKGPEFFVAVIILTIMVAGATFAQNPAPDSQEVVVPITEVSLNCRMMWFEPLVINDQKAFEKALEKEQSTGCERDQKLEIDFGKHTFIALSKFADCHAKITVRVTKNTEKKLYVIAVDEEYGGCRGMSPHNRAFLMEKLPFDYSVQFRNVKD